MKNNVSTMDQSTCCGCRACEQICPKHCITMNPDIEGFLVPRVDGTVCVDCRLCVAHCAQISLNLRQPELQKVYAAKNIDAEVQMNSTSGGIFDALAKEVLAKGGTVYGCAWNNKLEAMHIGINTDEELKNLHGSKYVQSNLLDTYTEVKNSLNQETVVLFSGTACQIAGLKQFLNKEYSNLITVDVICHGVPSPKLFQAYLEWLGKKIGGKIFVYDFRNKEKTAWGLTYKTKTKTKTKTQFINSWFDPYYTAFLNCDTYRECCYQCHYANENRVSDITLGDYWGVEKQHPKFFDDRGVSLVILNTKKGENIFSVLLADEKIIAELSTFEQAAMYNENLKSPSVRGSNRKKIEQYVEYEYIFGKILRPGITIRRVISAMVPLQIKRIIRKMRTLVYEWRED